MFPQINSKKKISNFFVLCILFEYANKNIPKYLFKYLSLEYFSLNFYEIRQISIVPSKFYSFYKMHVKHVFNINLYINCAVESGYGSLFLLDIVDGCIYKLKVVGGKFKFYIFNEI